MNKLLFAFASRCLFLCPLLSVATIALSATAAQSPSAAAASDFENQKLILENEKSALESDIKKLSEKILQTDSIINAETKYNSQTELRQKADLERRQGEIENLKQKIAELSSEMKKEKYSISSSQIKTENAEATRKALTAQMASHCRNLEIFVKDGLAWDTKERMERISALCVDLENGTATAEEGFSRLRALYAEEIRFGDEAQLSNRAIIRNDGETVNAQVLRIGNQWIVYQDDSRTRFGIFTKTADGYAWKEDLSFEERQAVSAAIDVKLSRKPPQMVKLPLSLSINSELNSKVKK